MSGPRVTLSTGSLWTYGLNRAFEIAQKSGFDAVEVIVDERWDTRQPEYLKRLSAETRIEIASLHSPFSALRGSKGYRACVEETMALADQVGAGTVVVHPESSGKRYGTWLVRNWKKLHESHSATLAVENMPYRIVKTQPKHYTHKPEQLLRFPATTLDTAHFGLAKIDILEALNTVRPKLRHIHLSDSKKTQEHLCPGDGTLPLDGFLQGLLDLDFEGIVVLELSPEALPVHDEESVIDRLRGIREACERVLHSETTEISTPERVLVAR